MWWEYSLVFLGAFLFDVVPFPFPPAFAIMVPLQIYFQLNPWWVICVGVVASVLGRFTLTLYIPLLADKIFKNSKNEDVVFLGSKLKEKGWKSQAVILAYSLLPLPTTPLFLAAGMAKIKPIYIIPAFFVGKFTSDTLAVFFGKYAVENFDSIMHSALSWKSISSFSFGILLLFALLFVDWRSLIQLKKFNLNFKIWK